MKNINNKGKNYSIGLPNVGGGQYLISDHINKLSEAIDRNRIRNVIGAEVKENNNGTSIVFPRTRESHPFKVQVIGSRVYMNIGSVFAGSTWGTIGINNFIPQYNEAKQIPVGSPCYYDSLPNANQDANFPSVVVFDRGTGDTDMLLYVEVASGGGAVFRYEDPSAVDIDPEFSYPIAYITEHDDVIQIVDNHIWAKEAYPFKIYTYYDSVEMVFYIKMAVGHVNNKIPKMEGKELTDIEAKKYIANDTMNYVWLKCAGEPKPADFPTGVTVEVTQTSTPPSGNDGYILVGAVSVTSTSGTPPRRSARVYQQVKNSLWAEAHRYETSKVDYFFYHV